jgi:hypothetical protein
VLLLVNRAGRTWTVTYEVHRLLIGSSHCTWLPGWVPGAPRPPAGAGPTLGTSKENAEAWAGFILAQVHLPQP